MRPPDGPPGGAAESDAPPPTTRLVWRCRERTLSFADRPLVMGILNVTPDSFSDGGRYADAERAVARALRMVEEGADIVDVGGESTRPGAMEVGADEEAARVLPVIEAIRGRTGAVVSVDTRKAAVAERALEAGAAIVNDVSALAHDPRMPDVVRRSGAGAVLMHMRGEPRTMQKAPVYADVVGEVAAYLGQRLEALARLGIEPDRLAVDPGIGFGKTLEHNLRLIAATPRFAALGRPVVLGMSRKSFLGGITNRPVGERMAASIAAVSFAVARGAHVLRVHDVKESCDAVRVVATLLRC